MSIKERVKKLLKEADLYRSQRLLRESRHKYETAMDLIRNNDQIQNRQSLLEAISKKIILLDTAIKRWDNSRTSPEVSSKVQDLIKKLFTFDSMNETDAEKAVKGAVTLAKFGQYKRALDEFIKLIKVKSVRIPAAKNALKCLIELSSADDAVAQFKEWEAKKIFSSEQLEVVRKYLKHILKTKGIEIDLDPLEEISMDLDIDEAEETADDELSDDDFIDITSIGVSFEKGPNKGERVELDVSFQAGNILSLIISNKDKKLIENFNVGVKLNDVDFYSPIAIFKGTGIVEANTKITSGPKQGDYSLDIKIEGI